MISKVITNEDKIRSMTGEELARLSVTRQCIEAPFLALIMIKEKKQNAVN